MKFALILLLSTVAVSNQREFEFNKVLDAQSVVAAITDAIRVFLIENRINFELLVYGEPSAHLNDVIDGVSREIGSEQPIIMVKVTDISSWHHRMKKSLVIFVSKLESLSILHARALLTNLIGDSVKFIVYVEELRELGDLESIGKGQAVRIGLSDMRFNEIFIVNNPQSVDLIVLQFYTRESCAVLTPTPLNSFEKASHQWSNELKPFDHNNDFHGCLLPFGVELDHLCYFEDYKSIYMRPHSLDTIQTLLDSERVTLKGMIHEVIATMAKAANFTPHYQFMPMASLSAVNPTRGIYFDEIVPLVAAPTAYGDNFYSHDGAHRVKAFTSINYYYLVSLNDLYSNYEKLLFPFDAATWLLFLMTFAVTFVIIIGINSGPKWLKIMVFGKGITMPAYNALGIFFGIGQTILPRENFSRIILTLFIWFCLIFRVCYQSMMFEFMTCDMRWPLPESIDELVRWNYTIAVLQTTTGDFHMRNDEIIAGRVRPRVLTVDREDYISAYRTALNDTAATKFAFLIRDLLHMQLNSTLRNTLTAMSGERTSKQMALMTSKNSIILGHLSRVVDHLIPSGILEYLDKFGMWDLARQFDVEPDDPRRILAMHDLEFGFVIWLVACCVSFMAFVSENLWFRLRGSLKVLIGLMDFLRALRARLSDYHDRW